MLVAQCLMALAHSLKVPDRIVALSHIHEPIRAWRMQLIDAALEEVGELHDVWWIVTVVTALAFASWLCCAYSLLDRPGDERCFRRRWAFLAWFVPFANLYVPKQILEDIVVALERHDRAATEARFVRNWVTAWWTCWVVLVVGTCWSYSLADSATTVVDAQNAQLLLAVCDFVVLVSAVAAWNAVTRVTRAQRDFLVDDVPHATSRRGQLDLSSTLGESGVEGVGQDT